MRIKLAILSLFLMILKLSNAQYHQGFVILSSGDTIKGTLRDYSETTSCTKVKFVNETGDKFNFKPKRLKGYKRGYETYVSKQRERPLSVVRSMKSFMKVLETGKVNLYGYTYTVQSGGYMGANGVMVGGSSYEKTDYYLEKSNGHLMLVRTLNFKRDMINYFSDNNELTAKLHSKELRHRNMREIVRLYNESYE